MSFLLRPRSHGRIVGMVVQNPHGEQISEIYIVDRLYTAKNNWVRESDSKRGALALLARSVSNVMSAF